MKALLNNRHYEIMYQLIFFFANLILCELSNANTDINLDIASEKELMSTGYDVVIFINDAITGLTNDLTPIQNAFDEYKKVDADFGGKTELIPFLSHPSQRMIYAPTGALNKDTTDSRILYDAAIKATQLMYAHKLPKALIVFGPFKTAAIEGHVFKHKWLNNPHAAVIGLLGALQGLYTPLTVRQMRPELYPKFEKIGVFKVDQTILNTIIAVEQGRYVTRDICGTDEQRMSAINVVDYIQKHLPASELKFQEIEINKQTHPLMAAVNRLVKDVKAYNGRIITMAYQPADQSNIARNVYLVGKGITFDTGGLSLKTKSGMLFMHKDKCGAAAIVGFFKTLSILKPKKLNAFAKLAFVRNGIGANAYSVDEIIPSQKGIRSRIGSTDAEGRNVMVDLLTDCITDITAANSFEKSQIIVIATLTGAVGLAFGKLTAVMDNGPAAEVPESYFLRDAGDLVGEGVEVSHIRREDYETCYPVTEYEQLQQSNTHPDTTYFRGYQYPPAFMMIASGLTDNSLTAMPSKRIKYTHMDVSSSVGVVNSEATGTPTSLLLSAYVLPEVFNRS